MASVEQPTAAPPKTDGLLFNPRTYDPAALDPESRRVLLATIEWFESRGKGVLKEHDRDRVWYGDFLDFVKRSAYSPRCDAGRGGAPDGKRWDTSRICEFNEITAFYGLPYWYTWQVSMLGLGPIWKSKNPAMRERRPDCSRMAGSSASASQSGAWRRHLLDRHAADPGRRRGLPRQRSQVLHRQR